jgi:UDP-GlcNAc:undecaprenyl-phosphate GlcNAc-1-phosphate transferase
MSGDRLLLIAAPACGTFVTLAEPLVIPLLQRAAALDVPNMRSSHTVPTPRGGGAPIPIGLVAIALLLHSSAAVVLAVALTVFGAIGLADVLLGLSATLRLAMQGAGSLAVAFMLLHRPGVPALTLVAAALVIALWLAGFVNVFNFMDGINAISGAHPAIADVVYAVLGTWRHDVFLLGAGTAVAASAFAFLPWNAVRARIFLGDVGSYGLATICYGSAVPSAGKEWVEVTCDSRRLVIDDFRSLKLAGKMLWRGRPDKGHRAAAATIRRAVTVCKPLPTKAMLASSHATIQAPAGI